MKLVSKFLGTFDKIMTARKMFLENLKYIQE